MNIVLNVKRSFTISPFTFIRKSGVYKFEVAHENVHRLQQLLFFVAGATLGWIMGDSILWMTLGGLIGEGLWFILYFTSNKFRWMMERPAWRSQLKKQIKAGIKPNVDVLIIILTTQYYGMIKEETAKRFLQRL